MIKNEKNMEKMRKKWKSLEFVKRLLSRNL